MTRMGVTAAVAIASALVFACATGHTLNAFNVPKDQAAYVTVMRPSRIGACCTIPLLIDDQVVVKLGARAYATITVPAGERVAAISRGMEGGGRPGSSPISSSYGSSIRPRSSSIGRRTK